MLDGQTDRPAGLRLGEVRHDMLGWYYCTTEEASFEDEGNSSVGFDLRPHFASIREAVVFARSVERGDSLNR